MENIRQDNEMPEAIDKWGWKYHHLGIPTKRKMMYKNNTRTASKTSGQVAWSKLYPELRIENYITAFFHTHPSLGISLTDRTQPSDQDKRHRDRALELQPNLQFFIITQPVNYGDSFPLKIDYTNWR